MNIDQQEEQKMPKEEIKEAKASPNKEIKENLPHDFAEDDKVSKPKWNFFDKIKKMFFKNKPDDE